MILVQAKAHEHELADSDRQTQSSSERRASPYKKLRASLTARHASRALITCFAMEQRTTLAVDAYRARSFV